VIGTRPKPNHSERSVIGDRAVIDQAESNLYENNSFESILLDSTRFDSTCFDRPHFDRRDIRVSRTMTAQFQRSPPTIAGIASGHPARFPAAIPLLGALPARPDAPSTSGWRTHALIACLLA